MDDTHGQPTITQGMIDLYNDYTHLSLDRGVRGASARHAVGFRRYPGR
jgi:hypothetical protein